MIIEPNYLMEAHHIPNDPLYNTFQRASFALLNRPAAMDLVLTRGVTKRTVVAVIDTGVRSGHVDLINQLRTGGGHSVIAGSHWGNDIRGHGTPVAGTIAAQMDNGV
jgi:hypothetical protein